VRSSFLTFAGERKERRSLLPREEKKKEKIRKKGDGASLFPPHPGRKREGNFLYLVEEGAGGVRGTCQFSISAGEGGRGGEGSGFLFNERVETLRKCRTSRLAFCMIWQWEEKKGRERLKRLPTLSL